MKHVLQKIYIQINSHFCDYYYLKIEFTYIDIVLLDVTNNRQNFPIIIESNNNRKVLIKVVNF